MELTFAFKHLDARDEVKEYAEEKSAKLKKYFHGKIHLTWTFSEERQQKIAHCHLVGNHMDYNGEAKGDKFHEAIDQVMHKIEAQIKKHKEIIKSH